MFFLFTCTWIRPRENLFACTLRACSSPCAQFVEPCRVKESDIVVYSNHQRIISIHHPIAKSIIKHYHEQYLHVGREQTLFSIHSRFWIPASHGLIHSVIKHCLYCKWEKAAPVTPFMANTSSDRFCFNEKQFTKTVVDYLGPYQIKLSKGTRCNQATAKRYTVLFTCLSTISPSWNYWRFVYRLLHSFPQTILS